MPKARANNRSGKRVVSLAMMPALLLAGCELFDAAKARLAVLGLDFSFERLDVSRLVYPGDLLQVSRDVVAGDRASLSRYGVDVRCEIRVRNPNAQRAVLDPMVARLRIEDTAASAAGIPAAVAGFALEARSDTSLQITFPLRLDSPVFSRSVWLKIARGQDMPYRISAEGTMRLAVPDGLGGTDTLSHAMELRLDRGEVDVRQTGQAALEAFLALVALVFE